jgi:hypothetical protein
MPGIVNYQVLGWFVTYANIGFLIPITIINTASLVVLLLAMEFARHGGYPDPHHPRNVTYDPNYNEERPDEWRRKVALQPKNVGCFHLSQIIPAILIIWLIILGFEEKYRWPEGRARTRWQRGDSS